MDMGKYYPTLLDNIVGLLNHKSSTAAWGQNQKQVSESKEIRSRRLWEGRYWGSNYQSWKGVLDLRTKLGVLVSNIYIYMYICVYVLYVFNFRYIFIYTYLSYISHIYIYYFFIYIYMYVYICIPFLRMQCVFISIYFYIYVYIYIIYIFNFVVDPFGEDMIQFE